MSGRGRFYEYLRHACRLQRLHLRAGDYHLRHARCQLWSTSKKAKNPLGKDNSLVGATNAADEDGRRHERVSNRVERLARDDAAVVH